MKRIVKRVCAAGLVLMAAMAGCAMAGLVDQSQTGYASFNDLHGDGLSGQTFTAGRDGELVGIRLLSVRGRLYP